MHQDIDGESRVRLGDNSLAPNRRTPAVITLHVPIVPEPGGFDLRLGLIIFGVGLLFRHRHRAMMNPRRHR